MNTVKCCVQGYVHYLFTYNVKPSVQIQQKLIFLCDGNGKCIYDMHIIMEGIIEKKNKNGSKPRNVQFWRLTVLDFTCYLTVWR